tara:strand:- start:731 stop:991 length:261 start_codon:yes stop_codon:yes gene_type:complete
LPNKIPPRSEATHKLNVKENNILSSELEKDENIINEKKVKYTSPNDDMTNLDSLLNNLLILNTLLIKIFNSTQLNIVKIIKEESKM